MAKFEYDFPCTSVVSVMSDSTLSDNTPPASKNGDHDGNSPRKHRAKRKNVFIDLGDKLDEGKSFADVPMDLNETEEEEGVVVLHNMFGRKILRKGTEVMKEGKSITTYEAEALRLAERLHLPTPRVHSVDRLENGSLRITMDYVEGEVLEDVWPNLSDAEKKSIARQLRAIVYAMRAAPPPTGPGPGTGNTLVRLNGGAVRYSAGKPMIGACGGGPARDAHQYFDYDGGPFATETDFNKWLLSVLRSDTPPAMITALSQRLRTDHRIVFTHGDLTMRNILVRHGRVVALLDWEYAGWYPEYWEYVKFLNKFSRYDDWKNYADEIFPHSYGGELVDFVALNHFQRP